MRTPRQEEPRDKQTAVSEGRSNIVGILPVDLFVGTSYANVSIGSSNWFGSAGWGESLDLANIRKGDISLGILVDWAQVAGLAAGGLPL